MNESEVKNEAFWLWTGVDGRTVADGPVAELKVAGCVKIFQEKVSGAKSDRKQLARVIARLDEGDVLVVTRLDRLARSTARSLEPA